MPRSMLLECANYMKDAAAKDPYTRYREKSITADAATGYLSIVEGLRELLRVRYMNTTGLGLTRILVRLATASVG